MDVSYTALLGDLDFDDTVTLADLNILQAHLNSTVTNAYHGDLNRDGAVDRSDVVTMLFGDPPHRFGSSVTQVML